MNKTCWVLLADEKPVGVFLIKNSAVIERLRLSRDRDEIHWSLKETILIVN